MKTNLILTSAVAMFVAMPAMAEPSNTGTFPTDGKMQADYTYTNAATSDNMAGVYENSVYANAQYTTNDYTVNAGFYLPADSENPNTTCTAGSFCPGLQSPVQYNATTNQGLESCPTGYGNSAEGASANTECYRTCAIANNGTTFTNIAHATAVSGNDYYNTTATDTCKPTECEKGWSVDLVPLIGNVEGVSRGYVWGNGYVGGGRISGYNKITKESNVSDAISAILSVNDPMAFAVDYGNKGIIRGHAQCSTQKGTTGDIPPQTFTDVTTMTTLPDSTGNYCWCQVDSYAPLGGNLQSLSNPWVYIRMDSPGCAVNCPGYCASVLSVDDEPVMRAAAMSGTVVDANATGDECVANYYIVGVGEYLPADTEKAATCTAGNYCPGLGQVTYNATTAQGLNACPEGYTNSATGAKANTECYRTCAIANNGTTFTNIAHATAVSGNDYYNTTATDTCVPTACENGWHLKAAAAAVNLKETIGAVAGTGYGYQSNNGSSSSNTSTYGITQNGEFVVDYGNKGRVHGYAQCSTQTGTNNSYTWSNQTTSTTLPDSTGQHCYCRLDGYTPLNGTMQNLPGPWSFGDTLGDSCASGCASTCASALASSSSPYINARYALFRTVQSQATPAMCEANEITITWSDAAAADITANNAGSVTYGGNINTPVKAATKKGKTFRGWIFSTTGPSNE